jgi:hypothetical protein
MPRCRRARVRPECQFRRAASQAGRLFADYIVKQVADFRSGARKHDVMTVMARTVDPADIVDIAAYFSSQKPMKGDGKGDNPVGRTLFEKGIPPAVWMPACPATVRPGRVLRVWGGIAAHRRPGVALPGETVARLAQRRPEQQQRRRDEPHRQVLQRRGGQGAGGLPGWAALKLTLSRVFHALLAVQHLRCAVLAGQQMGLKVDFSGLAAGFFRVGRICKRLKN